MIIIIRLLVLISLKIMPNNFSNFNRFLKPDYKPSFNGFGLDRRSVFSMKAGHLNVAYLLHCLQGDHHEIEPVSFIETDGFNQANFTRMSQHIDYFFVPYTCIKSQFHEWFQQTTDPINSLLADSSVDSSDFLPYFKLDSLILTLCYCSCLDNKDKLDAWVADDHSVDNYVGTRFLDAIVSHDAYQYKYLDYFLNSSHTSVKTDKLGYPIYLNTIRLLDQLRYGNFLPIIKLPNFTGNRDVCKDDDSVAHIAQDFELLFLPSIRVDLNVLSLAAYQAVCHNYYVNTYYERPDVHAYNFDDIIDVGDIQQSGSAREKGNQDLFTMNYRPWKKDIFLSALPSPQFGDVSVVTVLSDTLKSLNGSVSANTLYGSSISSTTDGKIYQSAISNNRPVALSGGFDVISLRKAEALQEWKQQIGRAGYRTRDRFRATFGREPGFDPQVLPVPIGSVYNEIKKDSVVGTAGDEFGEKRATGSSLLNNEKIVFDCPSFGVIIGIMSILPEADYDSFGIDKHHTYFEPFDFPTPQLQNLGLVPLNIRQLTVYSDAYYSGNGYNVGYVPEYSEDKTAVDLIHGEFSSMPSSFMQELKVSPVGSFASFVSSRIDMESFVGTVRQFYVDPAVLDNLFLVAADAEQNTDPFKVVFYSRVRSYRPLHVLGLT